MGAYDDIINLPHPTSPRHPRMPMIDRAAQFTPFQALTGYGDAIQETARVTGEKAELTEEEKAVLDEKLRFLTATGSKAAFTHFQPDGKKSGGAYVTAVGVVRDLIRRHWVNAPVFPDARLFFERCPVPIYIITNNGLPYIERALAQNGLNAAGVISADTVRAYKPHREIFDEALRSSGCSPEEAIHIGDSYDTDVIGARAAGIRPILLLRGRIGHDSVESADNLLQALELIFKIS